MLRRRWGGLIAAGVAVLLVACSDERTAPRPARAQDHVATVRAAAAETLEQGSGRVLISGTMTAGYLGYLSASGSADFERPRGDVRANTGGEGSHAVTIDGLDVYFKSPYFDSETSNARPWVATNADELVEILSEDGLWLGEISLPPALPLYFLLGTTRAKRIGTEDLDAASVERYDVRVDLRAAVDAASGEWREVLFDFLVRAIRLRAGDVVEMVAWIDSEGRIRRADAIVDYKGARMFAKQPASDPVGVSHLVWDFEDLGSGFDVRYPPANQTIPLEVVWRRATRHVKARS